MYRNPPSYADTETKGYWWEDQGRSLSPFSPLSHSSGLIAHCLVENIFKGTMCLTILAKGVSVLNKITPGNSNLFFFFFWQMLHGKNKEIEVLNKSNWHWLWECWFWREMTFTIPFLNIMKTFKLQIQTINFEQCPTSLIIY